MPRQPAFLMTYGRTIVFAAGCAGLWMTGVGLADSGIVRHHDGTSGTITPLGGDVGIYSDSHGNTGPVAQPVIPSSGPHADHTSGTVTPFGTPAPPNNLIPAPILPMNPNRPLSPQQPVAPSPSAPPQGFGPSSSGGRFGR